MGGRGCLERVCAVHTAGRESDGCTAAGCSAWGALRPQGGQAWRTPGLQVRLLQLQPCPLRSVARACTCDGPPTGWFTTYAGLHRAGARPLAGGDCHPSQGGAGGELSRWLEFGCLDGAVAAGEPVLSQSVGSRAAAERRLSGDIDQAMHHPHFRRLLPNFAAACRESSLA